jgi:hypothetical protein
MSISVCLQKVGMLYSRVGTEDRAEAAPNILPCQEPETHQNDSARNTGFSHY